MGWEVDTEWRKVAPEKDTSSEDDHRAAMNDNNLVIILTSR